MGSGLGIAIKLVVKSGVIEVLQQKAVKQTE
jgi:hypothetical protein